MIVDSELITALQLREIPKDIKQYGRYQIISLTRCGIDTKVIAEYTQCTTEIVNLWSKRSGIDDKPRCGRPLIYDKNIQIKTIAFYCQTTPLPGCGRWSLRWAEKYFKKNSDPLGMPISHSTIGRILNKHHLKPHLSKYFLQITDPDFFPKMEHIISLYSNQPEYLFCFDECPGIQILQRLAPDLQTEEMKKRLEEFEYIRHGTIDVFAFLRAKSGKVFARCQSDHTIVTLLEVFETHLKTLPENEIIHYVMDNLASHASYDLCLLIAQYSKIECPPEKQLDTAPKRREWLQLESKRIVFHYTPFHGSWLNMVEIWFGILNQKCLNESFDSPESLYNAIYAFINTWNTFLAHPFTWKYDGKGLHQKAVQRFVKILENSSEKMSIQFMTKQLLLMTNLMTYQDKVKLEIWMQLSRAISTNIEHLNNIIFKDDGPNKKAKAKKALIGLIDILDGYIHNNNKIAA